MFLNEKEVQWIEINRLFSIVDDNNLFGDLDESILLKYIASDLKLLNIPPLFLVNDVVKLLHNYSSLTIKNFGIDNEQLMHSYRNGFILKLLNRDSSIQKLHKILIEKGISERTFFIAYLVNVISRNLMEVYPFPYDFNSIHDMDELDMEQSFEHHLKIFLTHFIHRDHFFTTEQIALFSYIQSESDVELIKEYRKAGSLIEPMNTALVHKVRSSLAVQIEVDDSQSPSMGGISGITSGGSIEKLSSIVPSELSMMEKDGKIDLFDINLLENRIMSFVRDQYVDMRKRREFHIVFFTPDSLNYKPLYLPFRWQYFFISILFDIIAYYKHYFNIRHFPFNFVFPKEINETLDVFHLIDTLKAKDFPDLSIQTFCLEESELTHYMERIMEGNICNHSLLCVSKQGYNVPLEIPEEMSYTSLQYGGVKEEDLLHVYYKFKHSEKTFKFYVKDNSRLDKLINKVRDAVFLCLSGGVNID